jgi:hypothetical protein
MSRRDDDADLLERTRMVQPDGGLASATLAQLHLEQGHTERALAICRELLERDPTNGYALALERRMRVQPRASLTARFVSSSTSGVDVGVGQLELSWSVPRSLLTPLDDARLDVVVALARRWDGQLAHDGHDGPSALRYTSVRCRDLVAVRLLDVPQGPASAAAVLVLGAGPRRHSLLTEFRRRPDLRVLAVAEPTSW